LQLLHLPLATGILDPHRLNEGDDIAEAVMALIAVDLLTGVVVQDEVHTVAKVANLDQVVEAVSLVGRNHQVTRKSVLISPKENAPEVPVVSTPMINHTDHQHLQGEVHHLGVLRDARHLRIRIEHVMLLELARLVDMVTSACIRIPCHLPLLHLMTNQVAIELPIALRLNLFARGGP
jgi:hypothetical protein